LGIWNQEKSGNPVLKCEKKEKVVFLLLLLVDQNPFNPSFSADDGWHGLY
jgi:hypothetical protein